MSTINSYFRVMLARKEMQERRSISQRQVSRDSGVAMSTVQGLANNDFKAISREALAAVCEYLGCEVGDLLKLEPDDSPVLRAQSPVEAR